MRRVLHILACSAALAALGLVASANALATGTGTSAGDQQYVDPLTSSTATSTSPTTTSQASSPSTTPAASSTPSASSTSSSSSSASTTATSTSASPSTTSTASSSGTLPFTGLNLEACIAVGVGLLGAGLVLRWIVARV